MWIWPRGITQPRESILTGFYKYKFFLHARGKKTNSHEYITHSQFAVLWGWFNASFITKTYFRFNFCSTKQIARRTGNTSSHALHKVTYSTDRRAISKLTHYKFGEYQYFFQFFFPMREGGGGWMGQIKTERSFFRETMARCSHTELTHYLVLRNSDEETDTGPEKVG